MAYCAAAARTHLLHFALVLLGERVEAVHDDAGVRAIVHVDRWRSHPRLQIVDRQRDVLRVGTVEHPNFPVRRRPRHTVAIVVEQDALFFRVATQRGTQLRDILDRRIE
uniref:Putative secreted protein n=1 Tax=Anopheles triannulatus TaxID=58253 RepID=A0A2M4B2S5_9DIPT